MLGLDAILQQLRAAPDEPATEEKAPLSCPPVPCVSGMRFIETFASDVNGRPVDARDNSLPNSRHHRARYFQAAGPGDGGRHEATDPHLLAGPGTQVVLASSKSTSSLWLTNSHFQVDVSRIIVFGSSEPLDKSSSDATETAALVKCQVARSEAVFSLDFTARVANGRYSDEDANAHMYQLIGMLVLACTGDTVLVRVDANSACRWLDAIIACCRRIARESVLEFALVPCSGYDVGQMVVRFVVSNYAGSIATDIRAVRDGEHNRRESRQLEHLAGGMAGTVDLPGILDRLRMMWNSS